MESTKLEIKVLQSLEVLDGYATEHYLDEGIEHFEKDSKPLIEKLITSLKECPFEREYKHLQECIDELGDNSSFDECAELSGYTKCLMSTIWNGTTDIEEWDLTIDPDDGNMVLEKREEVVALKERIRELEQADTFRPRTLEILQNLSNLDRLLVTDPEVDVSLLWEHAIRRDIEETWLSRISREAAKKVLLKIKDVDAALEEFKGNDEGGEISCAVSLLANTILETTSGLEAWKMGLSKDKPYYITLEKKEE